MCRVTGKSEPYTPKLSINFFDSDILKAMSQKFSLSEIGFLPHEKDNCAVALVQLEPAMVISHCGIPIVISSTVPVGHRFAIKRIEKDTFLTSWNHPFGKSMTNIYPGEYVCNDEMLEELSHRTVDFAYPEAPNFENYTQKLIPRNMKVSNALDDITVDRGSPSLFFSGFERTSGRGVGTRNYIAVLAVSSRASSFARELVKNLNNSLVALPKTIDGIVSIGHTEGGGPGLPNNESYLLRTLAGFMVHPNIGAILVVETGNEPVSNRILQEFITHKDYPIHEVQHEFMLISNDFSASLARGRKIIDSWIDKVADCKRSRQPVSSLKIALQCGGSDSFSGISANPVIGEISRRLICRGGSANLAETDELVGAEEYILSNIRNPDIANRFVYFIQEFSERMRWHGHSPEGNPSGGNRIRGLYNIALKSLGAAMKKHPDVVLDEVIDYSERMSQSGFYFMNSPGNDLESIAGQVASGSNLIFFATGNGAVTNFPFVPTLKVISTSSKYSAQEVDMDINAGCILDGVSFTSFCDEVFSLALETASGQKTKGECSGHSQVSIWRDWVQTSEVRTEVSSARGRIQVEKQLLPIEKTVLSSPFRYEAYRTNNGYSPEQIGLIFPTSLCSSQIACLIADRINLNRVLHDLNIDRVVALPHTEGCGVSSGHSQEVFENHLFGYLNHPCVAVALLVEHGCEKVHLEYVRKCMMERHMDPGQFGWFSIQGDGGTQSVIKKADEWFIRSVLERERPTRQNSGLEGLSIGVVTDSIPGEQIKMTILSLAAALQSSGGSLIVSSGLQTDSTAPTSSDWVDLYAMPLKFCEQPQDTGYFVMDRMTDHPVEIVTGLGSSGVQVILVFTKNPLFQGHPFIPTLLLGESNLSENNLGSCLDLVLENDPAKNTSKILELIMGVFRGEISPISKRLNNLDFQITRGPFGISV